MRKFVLPLILITLFLISCGGEEIFAGRAYRLRAEQGLKEIRNALAKYEIEHPGFPPEDNWKEILRPYFRKERAPDPKWITERKMFVMGAKNNISQVKGIIKELKRKLYYADSTMQAKISEYLSPIDSSLTLAGYEIKEAKDYEFKNVTTELEGLSNFIENVNIPREKEKVVNRMENQREHLTERIETLRGELLERDSLKEGDLIKEEGVVTLFNLMENSLDKPLLKVRGEMSETADTLPLYSEQIRNQIDRLMTTLDSEEDSILIQDLKQFDNKMIEYSNGTENMKFFDNLREMRKKIPASISLFRDFYKKKDRVLDANKVLNGYSSLDNLRALVNIYEEDYDTLPHGNLYPTFKEEESMKEIKKDLASDPYLRITDNGYKLEAKATDSENTELVMNIEFINTYDELVEKSFSEGPFYETNDSNTTYFVWVKAKDQEKTLLTTRPKVKKEQREE